MGSILRRSHPTFPQCDGAVMAEIGDFFLKINKSRTWLKIYYIEGHWHIQIDDQAFTIEPRGLLELKSWLDANEAEIQRSPQQ